MTIYVCLDDRNGLRFNGRRQSRDGAVLEDIRQSLTGALWIATYSEKLIREAQIPFRVAASWEEIAGWDFFLEDYPSQELLSLARKIVIYRWNRHYPGDVRWDVDLAALGFVQTEVSEFPGKSHETITREVYIR